MASYDSRVSFPGELAQAIRKADVLTGEFLQPVPANALSRLDALGLASATGEELTRRGMEVRRWLMSGSDAAARELSVLAGRVAAMGSTVGARV